ncbi:MAG: acetyl-CoA carboxylase biotin carboxylase subunit [Acidobacteria bacterium]|nr:MAG: acetyl-CoA carboxylase biotin carboxylase subunit [Acidobacteriota bacterium]
MLKKLLIANRGEIAVRILRACRDLGITGVAVYSEVDRAALHVRMADEAYDIGPAPSRESYLRVDKLVDIARHAGCDALHPGYGFLAENPELPRACAAAGITFVGPSPEAMEQLGSKTAARELAYRAGVPVVPGVREPIPQLEAARRIAGKIGYPVLLKAVAGGGGKGMRMVAGANELAAAWRDAASEALNAFGDARVYIEKYLDRPRHIEMQIFSDAYGNVIYLGERECSVQRRHQKVIEEAPSTFMTPELRRNMGEAAVRLALEAHYTNAGTAEFLVDGSRHFYFLEVNTRLQVEHPVTEAVTGLDLVKLQLRVAAGERLPITQQDVSLRGHAMECRIYAEDPENHFFPSPGQIISWRTPHGPGIRLDEGVYSGWTVPDEYDPLLAKLVAWGADRPEALARLKRALQELLIEGIRTNTALFQRILADADFQKGAIHTRWLDERLAPLLSARAAGAGSPGEALEIKVAMIAAALWHLNQAKPASEHPAEPVSRWREDGKREQISRAPDR